MTGTRLYLGVDGGGTKTEFVCIDEGGHAVARAITGTTYHLQVGIDGAVALLHAGVQAVCGQLSIAPRELDFVFFGLPAYGEDALADPLLHKKCGEVLGHDRYACGNDMICGWAGSLACADGINLVAGTGSIGYGERAGRSARVGGWGEVFSDEGSAYWIAIAGLNAFTRMSDGRMPRGALHHLFVEALDLNADVDICSRIMGPQGKGRDEIAGLARIVSAAARAGDAVANEILDRAAAELSTIARTLRDRLGFEAAEPARLSWSGGILANEAIVRGLFSARIEASGGFQLVQPLHSPAHGAALYARHLHEATNDRRPAASVPS